ncbi:MAG TPA: adenylate/guanylate cyclase domain-containing protein [Alphaproteobacteria bacterium]|nr:adenylate/guanylate cyclase domain-containing protein [Alphaproteobacteria bacterium]
MSTIENAALFATLQQSAERDVVTAIEALVRDGDDRALNRINLCDFAQAHGFDEDKVIAAFVHAARLGLFEMSWNVLCPSCGGVLDSGVTLKAVNRSEYSCAFCALGYEPTLDETVEVSFTVSPSVRSIAAHAPDTLPFAEYCRQIFWSTGVDLPEDFAHAADEITLDMVELPPGEKAILSVHLPPQLVIIFDPVTHGAQFVDVKGEPTRERQSLAMILSKGHAAVGRIALQPGPLRVSFENHSGRRALPALWIADERMEAMLGRRKPFLTAKRLLTNQTFRDVYRTDTLDVDQRLKITSLTFLFTDLKGSTELYERVGDLVAYDLVKAHFRILQEIVAAESGAVVKTIGDAVMATFPTPSRAVAAALRMREAIRKLDEGLTLKIGIHVGPCLAVVLNERQDYFGQTVNIASRVQGLAETRSIYATDQVLGHSDTAKVLEARGITPKPQTHVLRGIAHEVLVYEIA